MKNYLLSIVLILSIAFFQNCTNDSSVNDNIETITENIFPMNIGNEWSYIKYRPDNPTNTSKYTYKCIKDTIIDNEIWYVFDIKFAALIPE